MTVLTTAVIGAGPAGLLFCLIGKILMGNRWSVQLFDKREHYVRTHRLRMDRAAYVAIQEDLRDERFDSLIAFLEEQKFAPEVNVLEAELTALLAQFDIRKIIREITSLEDISADTVVGADSVHSTVRELIRGPIAPQRHTHQRIARLRVVGDALPQRLNVVDQFRLSKVLGSVVDYRLNRNGFAEVDLFVSEGEYAALRALDASPKAPVPIENNVFRRLPSSLLRAVIEHLAEKGSVLLQSTFELEHTVMPKRAFEVAGRHVFLLGDAAVSLPFFRGMACLAACAHALARVHASGTFDGYDREVERIVEREIAVVRSRAQVVRGLRELVRLSSLLPFPIQSWWLSAARKPVPDRLAPSGYFNLFLALTALALSALGAASPPLVFVAVPVQVAGGIAYRWTLALEPGPHSYVRRIWEGQIACIALGGVGVVRAHVIGGAWWLFMGGFFAFGIYAFEAIVARRLERAHLE